MQCNTVLGYGRSGVFFLQDDEAMLLDYQV